MALILTLFTACTHTDVRENMVRGSEKGTETGVAGRDPFKKGIQGREMTAEGISCSVIHSFP